MNGEELLQAAIDIFGPVRHPMAALADGFGRSRQMMYNYHHGRNDIPAPLAAKIRMRQKQVLAETISRLSAELQDKQKRLAELSSRSLV